MLLVKSGGASGKSFVEKSDDQDEWIYESEQDALADIPLSGHVVVSLAVWQNAADQLGEFAGLGIRLKSDESPEQIVDSLDRFQIIVLEFPAFTDGRAYSYARLLRDRWNYRGEIRAVGNVLPDQLQYMARVGFDAFELDPSVTASADEVSAFFSEMGLTYQPD
ncbi:MAG: DUF934 domain-containing protein [Gammaproteobacteria bacterium]|nr:DUF934 domain-containing protein [Gammaproteobacteria bacterium]